MLAYLIDTDNEVVSEIEVGDSIQDIYDAIGARTFDVIRINEQNDVIFIDDNGLYEKRAYFAFGQYPNPIAGKGLVLGADSEGDSCAPQGISLEELQLAVRFLTPDEAYAMAVEADNMARESLEEYPDNVTVIHTPITEILDTVRYTEQS